MTGAGRLLPHDLAVQRISDAVQRLDDTIHEIRDHVFAARGHQGPPDRIAPDAAT